MSAAALKERLRADLKAAMQAKASAEVRVLRTLIAALDNAEAVPIETGQDRFSQRKFGDPSGEVARRELDAAAIAEVLAAEIASRLTAAAEYRQHDRAENATRLDAEITVIERYSPR